MLLALHCYCFTERFECGKLVVIRESESDLTIDEKEEADKTTLED